MARRTADGNAQSEDVLATDPPVLSNIIHSGNQSLIESRRFGEAVLKQLEALRTGQSTLDIDDDDANLPVLDSAVAPRMDQTQAEPDEPLGSTNSSETTLEVGSPLDGARAAAESMAVVSPLDFLESATDTLDIRSPLEVVKSKDTVDAGSGAEHATLAHAATTLVNEDVEDCRAGTSEASEAPRKAALDLTDDTLDEWVDELVERHTAALKRDLKTLMRRLAHSR